MTESSRRGVGLYLVLAFGLAWLTWIGLRGLGVPFVIRTALGMFSPAIAAALVRGPLMHERFGDAGLRLGPWRWYAIAYITVPLLLLAGLTIALLSGLQHWGLDENIQRLAGQLVRANRRLPPGFTASQLAQVSLVVGLVSALSFAIPINMLFTFGEEFGWRGYLLPRLAPLGEVPAAALTGVIWGLWHAPLIVLDGYNFPGHPFLGIFGMVVLTMSFGFLFAWLRFRSGSMWPVVLAHAALNAQVGLVLVALSPEDSLLRAPTGLLGALPFAAAAGWLVFSRRLQRSESAPVP